MSQSSDGVQDAVVKVIEAAVEPSYLSEIARNLSEAYPDETWNVEKVAQVVSMVADDERIVFDGVDYNETGGQLTSSPKLSGSSEGGASETTEWYPYTIIHNISTDPDEIDPPLMAVLDLSVTKNDKIRMIKELSGSGKEASKLSEEILQDEMRRQFQNYNIIETPDYNDPGVDFYVEDPGNRDYGLCIEVSVRWENPIDRPYIDSKNNEAIDRDADLVILAPKFSQNMRDKYEDIEDDEWHELPEGEITHLHHLPNDRPEIYRPFAFGLPPESERSNAGFPVILPDSDRVKARMARDYNGGSNYPIVDGEYSEFVEALGRVNRQHRAVTEGEYRAQMREAIEPLLWEFTRPYRIEQWLIETYWDQGLTQSEIGELAGVSDRTISEWLSERKFDIVTRGVNTELGNDVKDIWVRMYEGQDPFPKEMTGYEIQALYNRHPYFTLNDWNRWYSLSEDERANIMATKPSPRDNITYTIMLSDDNRLFPSYSFILNTLRSEGVEIRAGFFGETGTVYPTATALEFMLNRNIERLGRENEVDQRDVVEMRSDLEVQLAEYLSETGVPFGYEPWQIPSSFTGGDGSPDDLSQLVRDSRSSGGLEEWRRIYNKHELDSEGDVGIEEGYDAYNKFAIVPDFVLYPGAVNESKPADWIGWQDWEYVVELAGAYGVGIIDSWTGWYRVSGVAYKELAYKLLGVWDRTYFIVPDSDNLPQEVRNDPHYIVVNPSQLDAGFGRVGNQLGL